MLDQNTTTIIASVIAVLGTLGGAITGVVLSNRHTAKMEHLRIEQEKLRRNTEIIEETYSQLILFSELSNQAASDVMSLNISDSDFIEKTKEISLKSNRIYTLISLYHSSLKQELGDLHNDFNEYWITVAHLHDAKIQRQKANMISDLTERVKESGKKYTLTYQKLQKSLEALV